MILSLVLLITGPNSPLALCVEQDQIPVERPIEPTLHQLRLSAIWAFLGHPTFDETARLGLRDQLVETSFQSPCRSLRFLKEQALTIYSTRKFEEVSSTLKYPQHSLHLVRQLPGPHILYDIVLFYFRIEKAAGINCHFTVGSFVRTEDIKNSALESERDRLQREINNVISELRNILNPILK
jgi:hypothetical protein